MLSQLSIRIALLKFMVSFQSVIVGFFLNFSCVINLLFTKLARDHTGKISATRNHKYHLHTVGILSPRTV